MSVAETKEFQNETRKSERTDSDWKGNDKGQSSCKSRISILLASKAGQENGMGIKQSRGI